MLFSFLVKRSDCGSWCGFSAAIEENADEQHNKNHGSAAIAKEPVFEPPEHLFCLFGCFGEFLAFGRETCDLLLDGLQMLSSLEHELEVFLDKLAGLFAFLLYGGQVRFCGGLRSLLVAS